VAERRSMKKLSRQERIEILRKWRKQAPGRRWLGVRRSEVALWKELVADAGVEEVEVFADPFTEEGRALCTFLDHPPGARRLTTREEEANADEAPISYRDAALAAKDETIAELRQRVASLEQHLETLESLLAAALERGGERPAPLDENKDVSGDKRKTPRARSSHPVDGGKLRELRYQRMLTGEQLANKAGLSVAHISRIEQGRLGGVKASTLLKLAKALEVEDEELRAD
jgi:DNA-binding Xre family transcriptional regulator